MDPQYYKVHKMCYDCVIDKEHEIKKQGKWEEYQKQIHNSDIDGIITDYKAFVEAALNESNESFITEGGDVENWVGGINKERAKEALDEQEEEEVETEEETEEIETREPRKLSSEEQEVQNSLEKALEAAKGLGNEKLVTQIGNTITYFTRSEVIKEEQSFEEDIRAKFLRTLRLS